jgi:hypothetical protein
MICQECENTNALYHIRYIVYGKEFSEYVCGSCRHKLLAWIVEHLGIVRSVRRVEV